MTPRQKEFDRDEVLLKAMTVFRDKGYDATSIQDLVEQMLRERGWELDRDGWQQAEERHRRASRGEGEGRFRQLLSAEQLEGLAATQSTYHEDGERSVRLEAQTLLYAPGGAEGAADKLVLAASPFSPVTPSTAAARATIPSIRPFSSSRFSGQPRTA